MSQEKQRVVVTGVGVISPLGDTPATFAEALLEGRSGIAPVELFDAAALACRTAGEVRGFSPQAYLGDGNLRPLDRTAHLVASAAQLALTASGFTAERRQSVEVGLALGTMFGSVHTISEFDRRALVAGPNYAKPLDFANSVINAAAGQTAIWHNLRGVNSTLSGGLVSGLQALAYASEQVRSGRSAAILAGGGDELCFESYYGFHQAGLLAQAENDAVPFAAGRSGFVPGEGAALFLLEDAATAAERGAVALAEIRGHGQAFDPSRGRDAARATAAVVQAIRAALADAGCAPQDIDAVSAGANGSVAGDRHEAQGLLAVFGVDLPPVFAVKAGLGEALGASGAFQTVALLEAMQRGVVPGVRGLERLDDDLPAAFASPANQERDIRRGLVTAVGLDGQVAALVIERASERTPS